MRQIGCHHLILPDGRRVDMAVVVLDGQGRYVSHRCLRQDGVPGTAGAVTSFVEEPFVEWVGGTVRIDSGGWIMKDTI